MGDQREQSEERPVGFPPATSNRVGDAVLLLTYFNTHAVQRDWTCEFRKKSSQFSCGITGLPASLCAAVLTLTRWHFTQRSRVNSAAPVS